MYYIGVDLGGTNIAAGVVNSDFEIVKKGSVPTNAAREPDEIIKDMAELCKKLVSDADLTLDDIEYVGISTPGTANSKTGVVEYANNLPFLRYPIADKLSSMLGVSKVYIENDANAAAKAEAMAGVAKGAQYSVMITLGTGLGGGIVIDNKVYSGFNFAGAELGHIVIEKDGRQCTCGRKGCWEAYSSATALIRMAHEEAALHTDSLIHKRGDELNAKDVFDFAESGDAAAQEALQKYYRYLIIGLANTINVFQPEYLIIGGGPSAQGDKLLNPVVEGVKSEVFASNLVTKVVIAELGNDAGVIGAAMLGRNA